MPSTELSQEILADSDRPGLAAAWWGLLRRDLLLAMRNRAELLNPLVFFVIVVTLFPLGVGASPQLLARMAPGVLWVAALLASLLALDHLFRADYDDGALEQLLLSPHPLAVLVFAKILAHWLVTGLPLLLLSPLLGVMLSLPVPAMGALMATLALGTPILSLIGAIGAALTVGLRRGGVLLSLLILPLYIPVLIFAAGAVDAAAAGLPVVGHLWLLGAMLALAATLAPWAAAAALRISLD
ncbi:MAG: heme exporter protein CcmB [Candidatus Competibacteraceae bacterium]|nr:heme exporter protein CcmB [Candidatus Competibacteraceae bacterium]